MENKKLIRFILILLGLIEYCITCNCQRHALSTMLFFIICWLIKDLYVSWTEMDASEMYRSYSYNNPNYSYYSAYGDTSHSSWKPSKQYVSQFETVTKMVVKSIKPNMNVVLETQEKTVSMNDKKTKYLERIDKIDVSKIDVSSSVKQQLLLPPPKETVSKQTNEPSIIIITNSSEIDAIRKNVYNSIISFLNNTFKNGDDVKKTLDYITYIDVVQETRSAFIYVNDVKSFNSKISTKDLIEFIKKDSDMNGVVSVDEYKSLTISDYFVSCKKK